MEYEAFEKEDRLIIDMKQNHALANLIRKKVWENDGEAGYDKGHPLGDESNLVIKSDNPKEVLQEAVESAKENFTELEAQL
ncbi:RpoL/Rpb11 RNA polymerase subunit family protein [Candidatus Nanosalina sp. VS9-1]|uniref:RpoL/Rpb11 RNA polymerase subunit family protein n=1 Tax=Candidatus Nanosalina sp. VS9-1 TaxID=3388566 RepID=UPI0039E16517